MTPEWKKLREWVRTGTFNAILPDYLLVKMDEIEAEARKEVDWKSMPSTTEVPIWLLTYEVRMREIAREEIGKARIERTPGAYVADSDPPRLVKDFLDVLENLRITPRGK